MYVFHKDQMLDISYIFDDETPKLIWMECNKSFLQLESIGLHTWKYGAPVYMISIAFLMEAILFISLSLRVFVHAQGIPNSSATLFYMLIMIHNTS